MRNINRRQNIVTMRRQRPPRPSAKPLPKPTPPFLFYFKSGHGH